MPTDEELFEEYLQLYCDGKTSRLHESVAERGAIKSIKISGMKLLTSLQQLYGPDLPIPYIGYIDEPALNACAFSYQHRNFIGINAGTVFILFDVFSRMLSHPDLFLNIGDPTKETPPQPFYDQVTNLRYIDQNDTVFPKDDARMNYAIQFAFAAHYFLILHEYGHLMNGHIDWLNQSYGIQNLFELEASETPGNLEIGGMLRQTLEVDADVIGANLGFESTLAQVKYFKENPAQQIPFKSTNEIAIYNWMFAVYTLFRLFGQNSATNNLESLKYPPPAVRAFYIMSTVVSNYKLPGFPDQHITDILVKARLDSENALDKVFYNGLSKETSTYAYIQATQLHASKLTRNYRDNIRPLLKPYDKWPTRLR